MYSLLLFIVDGELSFELALEHKFIIGQRILRLHLSEDLILEHRVSAVLDDVRELKLELVLVLQSRLFDEAVNCTLKRSRNRNLEELKELCTFLHIFRSDNN